MVVNACAFAYSICLFGGLLVCLKLGHRMARHQHSQARETKGGEALSGAVFALFGLLLAFSFSNSLTRYSETRSLLAIEANNIVDIYRKLDLLPDKEQSLLRPLLHSYAEERLKATQAAPFSEIEEEDSAISRNIRAQLWLHIAEFVKKSNNAAISNHIISSFDSMSDAPAVQLANWHDRPPEIIYVLIFVLGLMAALLAGYGMADRAKLPKLRVSIFSMSVAVTMYVILDIESPGSGFFNAASSNEMLQQAINVIQ